MRKELIYQSILNIWKIN